MQIVGGRWEVCLGDGSCVLSFLSFPSECFNLYITVREPRPWPWPRPAPAGSPGPAGPSRGRTGPSALASHLATYTRACLKF